MLSLVEKGSAFAELHERAGTFIIPNPWDAGGARLLAHLGFEALAKMTFHALKRIGSCRV